VRNTRGFTLIELMTVVLIVGTLINIALPNYNSIRKSAHAARVVSDFTIIRDAATLYNAEKGEWPKSTGNGKPPKLLKPYLPLDLAWNLKPDLDVKYKWENFGKKGKARKAGPPVGLSVFSNDRTLLRAIYGVHRGPVWPARLPKMANRIILIVERS
jgi:prepilin-type N-terminal cleavage/methylation domain-containing protein